MVRSIHALVPCVLAFATLPGAAGAQGVLYSWSVPPGQARGAAVGDVDGDGGTDLALGEMWATGDYSGRLRVFSGATGEEILRILGPAHGSAFGSRVAGLGDVDHDGVSDLVVGSPYETVTPQVSWGRVRLLSGATGPVLQLLEGGGNLAWFGEAVAAYPDLDGDGVDDLALSAGMYKVGCCSFYSAELRIYSSASAVPLYFGDGHAAREFEVVPDVSHDGYADYLLPSTYVPSGEWSAALIAPWQLPPIPLPGCPAKRTSQGCTPEIAFHGAPSPTAGDALVVEALGLIPATVGFFLWSTQSASIPFGGGMLCLANRVHRSPLLNATAGEPPCVGSSQPTGSMSGRFPDGALLALGLPPGSPFYVQAWFRDPGFSVPNDIGLTGAIVFTLWP